MDRSVQIIMFVVLIGFFTLLAVLIIRDIKRSKPLNAQPATFNLDEPLPVEMRVRVTDMLCTVKSIGMQLPETVREFYVCFEDEYGKLHQLPVTEEYYEGFEIGQVGILTLVDGKLFSFELD